MPDPIQQDTAAILEQRRRLAADAVARMREAQDRMRQAHERITAEAATKGPGPTAAPKSVEHAAALAGSGNPSVAATALEFLTSQAASQLLLASGHPLAALLLGLGDTRLAKGFANLPQMQGMHQEGVIVRAEGPDQGRDIPTMVNGEQLDVVPDAGNTVGEVVGRTTTETSVSPGTPGTPKTGPKGQTVAGAADAPKQRTTTTSSSGPGGGKATSVSSADVDSHEDWQVSEGAIVTAAKSGQSVSMTPGQRAAIQARQGASGHNGVAL